MDYTGFINRMRLDIMVNAVYLAVASASAVSALLADEGVELIIWVKRICGWNMFTWSVYVAGSGRKFFMWDGCGRMIQQRFVFVNLLSELRLSNYERFSQEGPS